MGNFFGISIFVLREKQNIFKTYIALWVNHKWYLHTVFKSFKVHPLCLIFLVNSVLVSLMVCMGVGRFL